MRITLTYTYFIYLLKEKIQKKNKQRRYFKTNNKQKTNSHNYDETLFTLYWFSFVKTTTYTNLLEPSNFFSFSVSSALFSLLNVIERWRIWSNMKLLTNIISHIVLSVTLSLSLCLNHSYMLSLIMKLKYFEIKVISI